MNKTARIGIDPGKGSYIVVIDEQGEIFFNRIPMIGSSIDVKGLSDIFYNIDQTYDEKQCVIENVHAIFGSSADATFTFGYVTGLLEALLVAYEIPFVKVNPKVWQKEMWEGVPIIKKPSSSGKTSVNDTKSISEIAAKRLFPNVDLRPNDCTNRCKNSDHNKVDALLIASYCKRKFN